MDLGLTGAKAVVTGASEGIGLAIASRLAAEGCALYGVARTERTLAAGAAAIEASTGTRPETVIADLGDPAGIDTVAARCADADILINNAGAIPPGGLHEISEDAWRESWDVKVFGYIKLARALYPRMKERGRGVIVNVIGTGGERPSFGYVYGAAANAALIAFTRALGSHSMDDGIRVVGINPGPVETKRSETVLRHAAQSRLGDANRWRDLLVPLAEKRAATVDEIAAAVAFLAAPVSSYTSGTVVTVDGGLCHRSRV